MPATPQLFSPKCLRAECWESAQNHLSLSTCFGCYLALGAKAPEASFYLKCSRAVPSARCAHFRMTRLCWVLIPQLVAKTVCLIPLLSCKLLATSKSSGGTIRV